MKILTSKRESHAMKICWKQTRRSVINTFFQGIETNLSRKTQYYRWIHFTNVSFQRKPFGCASWWHISRCSAVNGIYLRWNEIRMCRRHSQLCIPFAIIMRKNSLGNGVLDSSIRIQKRKSNETAWDFDVVYPHSYRNWAIHFHFYAKSMRYNLIGAQS